MTDLPGCYGSTVTRGKRKSHNRSYLIFIVLKKQELILLGHEIYVVISVGVWDFQMPKCWGLKLFHNFFAIFTALLCSILNDHSLNLFFSLVQKQRYGEPKLKIYELT